MSEVPGCIPELARKPGDSALELALLRSDHIDAGADARCSKIGGDRDGPAASGTLNVAVKTPVSASRCAASRLRRSGSDISRRGRLCLTGTPSRAVSPRAS